jgi:RimJ/RimL family protein N-acetyltransferase
MRSLPDFNFTPALVGDSVVLRPLLADDFESLYAVAADPLLWEQHPSPLRYQREVFTAQLWDGAIQSAGALVITDKTSGAVIGSSRYYDWDPQGLEVAIGYTFLARAYWGGATNGEIKRLMLAHAFRWAKVVWFHIGVNNKRSCMAMEKIGGKLSHEADRISNGVAHRHAYYRIDAPKA